MRIGTIYYIIDDIFQPKITLPACFHNLRHRSFLRYLRHCIWGNNRPVGAVKMNYLHCALLANAGYDAKPLVMGKYAGNFFGYDKEIVTIRDVGFELNENDVVVCDEFNPYNGLKFENCIKVVFIQGWSTINKMLRPEHIGRSHLEFGYDYAMSCSKFNTNYVREQLNLTAHTVTNGIDTNIFFEDPDVREEHRVLCLPRKHKDDLQRIKALVRAHLPATNFVEVDNLTQDELALEYRKSDIFLATGYPEGFSLPPLEAMSSGCAVVGFTGGGGGEFMIDRETAMVAEDGDCEEAAAKLLEILKNALLKNSIREKGLEIAQRYTLRQTQDQLQSFFQMIETDRGFIATEQPAEPKVHHTATA